MDRINVMRSAMPPFEEYCEEIRSIWDSRWLTNMGEKHEALTQALREKLEVPGISLFTNGHLALEAILRAMNLQGEVITTPFTFASTTHAIARCGFKPVFCDVKEDDYTIDPSKIEALITKDTCAILPVHGYRSDCLRTRPQGDLRRRARLWRAFERRERCPLRRRFHVQLSCY